MVAMAWQSICAVLVATTAITQAADTCESGSCLNHGESGASMDSVVQVQVQTERQHKMVEESERMEKACSDTDSGAKDKDGWSCAGYSSINCGKYDDSDFSSNAMCCVCGGGSTEA